MKQFPKIAMGAWAWGNESTFGNRYSAEELRPVYEAAMRHGFCLWDTAAIYGKGLSESVLGELAAGTPRESILYSTKFTPQIEDGTPESMAHMLRGSMERLRTEVIDVYWIHHPTNIEKYTPMLIPLAKEGLIRQIGVSNHSLAEIRRVNAILAEAGLGLSAVQNHYSLLNRSSEGSGILEYCRKNGITFYAYMVLEQGALSGAYDTKHPFPAGSSRDQVYTPLMGKIETLTGLLRQVGAAHGLGTAQTAIAWAIAKGTLPVIGVTKARHVEDAARAASVRLTEEETARLEACADALGLSTVRHWEKKME